MPSIEHDFLMCMSAACGDPQRARELYEDSPIAEVYYDYAMKAASEYYHRDD